MTHYLVQAVTRRKAFLIDEIGNVIEAQLRSSSDTPVCGDRVTIATENGTNIVASILKRKNILSRAYREKTKYLAANIDLLFIISAVQPPPNTTFIDRMIAACVFEAIEFVLVINKTDLNASSTVAVFETYKNLGYTVILSCAKSTDGTEEIERCIQEKEPSIMTLCGLSGVGKSSIINRLIPGAIQKTSEISAKSGQGKQTTTMGELYSRKGAHRTEYVIDLPGLQHFGVSHIPLESIRDCFDEFRERAPSCQFQDCSHTNEPNCAVQNALLDGTISRSRYNSYLHMREELISGKPY